MTASNANPWVSPSIPSPNLKIKVGSLKSSYLQCSLPFLWKEWLLLVPKVLILDSEKFIPNPT